MPTPARRSRAASSPTGRSSCRRPGPGRSRAASSACRAHWSSSGCRKGSGTTRPRSTTSSARRAPPRERAAPVTDLLALTEELCAVPSESLAERGLADLVEGRLRDRAHGLGVERVGDNVVVRSDLGRARRVLLGGHLDTVPANGNATPRRDGDTLHGLGTSDMKGGLAVMLTLAEALAARAGDARFDATFVFYAGEEIAEEWNGLRDLFARAPELMAADLAILLEPTDGWVEAGCQGTLHLRATYRGARAHSARPWMGDNAIHRASGALGRIADGDPGPVE